MAASVEGSRKIGSLRRSGSLRTLTNLKEPGAFLEPIAPERKGKPKGKKANVSY